MTRKAFEKIQAGLTDALAHARGEDVGARIHYFVTAEERIKKNVAHWVETPEVQESLRRNHAEMKAKASSLTTPPST